MLNVSMSVNGKAVEKQAEPRTLLVDFLRDTLELTGTHIGCDTSQCGACTVHVDGRAVKSCTMLAVQAQDSAVTTIEGLGVKGLHPMQRAFNIEHALQCGYCTPGMIMMAVDIVRRCGTDLNETRIRHELEGNICRCTGYHNIVRAILRAGREMAPAGTGSR